MEKGRGFEVKVAVKELDPKSPRRRERDGSFGIGD